MKGTPQQTDDLTNNHGDIDNHNGERIPMNGDKTSTTMVIIPTNEVQAILTVFTFSI